MPGFNTLPAVGGGGGQANMTYVASVHMETFNRSWAQGGTPGYYALYSTNQESGYAYFVGTGVSTGIPLNRLSSVSHAFTRIDIIAPTNDMISLYKAKVKSTTVYNNPFDADATIGKLAIPSFPSVITSSGNFVLPNNALPLVNVVMCGAGGSAGGGHGDGHGGCGGGGGGGVVKLTAYQAVGTTSITIGARTSHSGAHHRGYAGGSTYFGNVYAMGGGGGGGWDNRQSWSFGESQGGVNSGGNGGGSGQPTPGSGGLQTAGTGLGTAGSPQSIGGYSGGQGNNGNAHDSRAGGGAGAGANGSNGGNNSGGQPGTGHTSNISGADRLFGPGGSGSQPNNNNAYHSSGPGGTHGHGGAGSHNGHNGSNTYGQHGSDGVVIVRYYIA
jgi:hypothetical protein